MTESASPSGAPEAKALPLILRVGLIAGTLDISDSLVFNHLRGVTPAMVFHYIASGLMGMRSFDMGTGAVALGVAIHYTIALGWTAVFYVLSRKFTVLTRYPVISGLLYGAAVYLIMNLVVLPLSAVPHLGPMTLAARINGVLAVMICIGLTIALLMRRGLRQA